METLDYPFAPRNFRTANGNMHYIDEGQGDPIVFVHGNPTWSFEFRLLVREFSATHRCIAPDHLGFGLSDKPADFDYLPESHAKNLEALLLGLDLKNITFMFGDWGGPIALSFAGRHPDRVRAMLITNTWCWPVGDDWNFRIFSAFMGGPLGRFLIRRFNIFAGAFLPNLFAVRDRLTKELHARYTEPFAKSAERKGNWVFPGQIVKAGEWLAEVEARLGLLAGKNIAICWGEKDLAFRKKELSRWRRIFPDAVLTTLRDCGHYVAEERPEAASAALKALLAEPARTRR